MMLEELRVSFKGVPGLVSPPAFAPVSDPAQLAEMNNAAVNCCKAATIWKNFGNVLSSISATITSGDHATAINTISGYNDASGTRVPGVIDKLGSPAYFSKPADQSRSEASYNSLVLPTNLMALLDLVSQSLTTGNASAANVYLRVAKDVQELYYITNRLAYNLAKGSMPNASFDITDLERNLAANFRQVGDDATSFISKLSTAITSIRQGIVSGKSYDALSVSGSLLFGLGKAITETDPTTSTTALSIDRFLLNNKAYQDAITGTTPGTGGPVTTPGAGYDLIHKKAFEKLLEANSAFASLERNKLIDSFERAYYDIFKGAGRVTESATVKKAREMLFVDGANISDAAVLEKLGLLTQMYFELGIKTSRNIIAKSDDEDQLKTLLGRKYEDITNKFGAIWGAAAIVNEDTQLQQDRNDQQNQTIAITEQQAKELVQKAMEGTLKPEEQEQAYNFLAGATFSLKGMIWESHEAKMEQLKEKLRQMYDDKSKQFNIGKASETAFNDKSVEGMITELADGYNGSWMHATLSSKNMEFKEKFGTDLQNAISEYHLAKDALAQLAAIHVEKMDVQEDSKILTSSAVRYFMSLHNADALELSSLAKDDATFASAKPELVFFDRSVLNANGAAIQFLTTKDEDGKIFFGAEVFNKDYENGESKGSGGAAADFGSYVQSKFGLLVKDVTVNSDGSVELTFRKPASATTFETGTGPNQTILGSQTTEQSIISALKLDATDANVTAFVSTHKEGIQLALNEFGDKEKITVDDKVVTKQDVANNLKQMAADGTTYSNSSAADIKETLMKGPVSFEKDGL